MVTLHGMKEFCLSSAADETFTGRVHQSRYAEADLYFALANLVLFSSLCLETSYLFMLTNESSIEVCSQLVIFGESCSRLLVEEFTAIEVPIRY